MYQGLCDDTLLLPCEYPTIPQKVFEDLKAECVRLGFTDDVEYEEKRRALVIKRLAPYKKAQRNYTKYFQHVRRYADAVRLCSRWFDVDYYRMQGVKDLKHTCSCNSKFCDGCQSAISQRRYERFEPLIEELQKTHDVAHVVITVPNCKSKDLYQTLQRMYETRKYFIRFLQGSDCIRGIDLKKYGFHGGIMALEISRNDKDGTFHPHFHCCFVFERKSGVFDRRHTVVNSYSFNNAHYKGKKGDTVRMFNQFEILLQKIWRLRYDGVEVNRHTIAALKEGYSIIVERKENFKEVFKYATKGVLRWNKDVQRVLGNYTDFVYLDYSLYSRRLIQTYGIFRGIPLPETVDQDEQDDRYKRIIDGLRFLEDPIEQREYLEAILDQQESQNIKYISRHNIAALLSSNEGGSDA
jgi:plasmid rolling circle replication initiator protein Rep